MKLGNIFVSFSGLHKITVFIGYKIANRQKMMRYVIRSVWYFVIKILLFLQTLLEREEEDSANKEATKQALEQLEEYKKLEVVGDLH